MPLFDMLDSVVGALVTVVAGAVLWQHRKVAGHEARITSLERDLNGLGERLTKADTKLDAELTQLRQTVLPELVESIHRQDERTRAIQASHLARDRRGGDDQLIRDAQRASDEILRRLDSAVEGIAELSGQSRELARLVARVEDAVYSLMRFVRPGDRRFDQHDSEGRIT